MDKEKKFIVEKQKYSGETKVISLRIPKDMLDDLDLLAEETGRRRNEVILLALNFSLEHLEVTDT